MPDCLFCKIIAGTIPARLLHQDDHAIAFADINPQAPTHILVVPRAHFATVAETPPTLLGQLLATAASIAAEQHLDSGYRLVINTGEDGGQTVDHLHIHLLGGRTMTWPPG